MILRRVFLVFCIVCMAPALLFAEDGGFKEISAPETKLMMEENSSTLLINVLSALEYELQHIPGSISIPIDHLKGSSLLPKEKDRPLIFYCMGPR